MPVSVETTASGMAIKLTCKGRARPSIAGLVARTDRYWPVWHSRTDGPSSNLPAISAHTPKRRGDEAMVLNQEKLDALVGRLFGDLSAGYGGVMVSLGDKLGLYRAMAGA